MRRNEAPEIVGQRVLAIVRHFGKPRLFITITTNPDWDDITRELLTDESGVRIQTWRDRPDLVARVFNFRLQEVLQELRRDNIFGKHVASVYTVEFQKRGLPHAHILHFLNSEDQFDTPAIHGPCEGDKNARRMKEYGSGVTDEQAREAGVHSGDAPSRSPAMYDGPGSLLPVPPLGGGRGGGAGADAAVLDTAGLVRQPRHGIPLLPYPNFVFHKSSIH